MQQKIKLKIQKALASTEFNVEILPARRGKGKAQLEGYKKKQARDDQGNPIDKQGNLILSRLRVGKTMTPQEQYLRSARNPYRKDS